MEFIAHRGLIEGPNKTLENHPDQIKFVIEAGYSAEIDLWYNNDLWLGHDEPTYKVDLNWLKKYANNLWIHCKNLDAMEYCFNYPSLNYFSHQNDDYVITSKGYVWAYPGQPGGCTTIMVMPEYVNMLDNVIEQINNGEDIRGVCTDYAKRVRDETKRNFTW